MNEPLLIVNADDFGLTPGVCRAILDAAQCGVVTSTSALAVAPAWPEFSGALADSGLGVGIHLCAVGEDPPLLSAVEIPTLVDGAGRFPATWQGFVRRAALGRVDVDELRSELAAQCEAVIASGARVTHLDSHQNLHHLPQFARVLFELAKRHGTGAARVARSNGWGVGPLGVRVLGARFSAAARREGLVLPDASSGLDEAGRLNTARIVDTVERWAAAGVDSAELACHPGAEVDPDRSRYRWGYSWAEEYAAVCDPATRRAIDNAGWRLGDFGDLVARRAEQGRGSATA